LKMFAESIHSRLSGGIAANLPQPISTDARAAGRERNGQTSCQMTAAPRGLPKTTQHIACVVMRLHVIPAVGCEVLKNPGGLPWQLSAHPWGRRYERDGG
jgi:hypothetical protein